MSRGVVLAAGAPVIYRGERCRIVQVTNLREVLLRDGRGELVSAPIRDLSPEPASEPSRKRPLDSTGHEVASQEAQRRYEAIRPLLHLGPTRTRAQVADVAKEHGRSPITIYRWLKRFEEAGSVDGLLHQARSDRGEGRLPEVTEQVMASLIDSAYLVRERPSVRTAYEKFRVEMARVNRTRAPGEPALRTPSFQTFYRRIHSFEEYKRVSRRYGHKVAERLKLVLASYPGAIHPLAVLQIDHTPLDIQLVDTVHRLPIGRPWLTLVLDVFSRMVVGFYISLDKPNAFAAGSALAHAILPKDLWLARHQEQLDRVAAQLRALDGANADAGEVPARLEWPCWGKPVVVEMDNAREFRGKTIERALLRHGIDRQFRPPGKPRYSGHIERMLKTLLGEVHSLPGTTFSNPRDKGDYDAEGRAVMTLDALETWITAFLLGVYHHRVHSELGVTPQQMWETGLLDGTELSPPTGLPERIMGDRADRLRLDFLPYFDATVQRYGIKEFGLTYQGPVLNSYKGAKNPDHPTHGREFQVSYDPRDISAVYFLDPDLDRYFEVRCRQPDFPSMSKWELEAVKRFAKQQHVSLDNEQSIMNATRLMQQLVQEEQGHTKSVRAEAEKQRRRAKVEKPAGAEKARTGSRLASALDPFKNVRELKPFDDIDMS